MSSYLLDGATSLVFTFLQFCTTLACQGHFMLASLVELVMIAQLF